MRYGWTRNDWPTEAVAWLSLVGLRMTGPDITGVVMSGISMAVASMAWINMGSLCVRGILAMRLDFALPMDLYEIYIYI